MNKKHKLSIYIVFSYFVLLAASKFMPHSFNFSPVVAIAIFGGFLFGRNGNFIWITLILTYVSDFIFNNFIHPEYFINREGLVFFDSYMTGVYLSLITIIILSSSVLKRFKYKKLAVLSLGSSFIFYLITNFVFLYDSSLYTHDFAGMIDSYIAAIPFFRAGIAGDVFYSFVFFGLYHFISIYSNVKNSNLALKNEKQ